MAFLPDTQTAVQDRFSGSLIRLDSYSVPVGNALYAQNCDFLKAEVSTRLGHSVAFTIPGGRGGTTSLYNWLFIFSGPALGATPITIAMYYCPAVGAAGYKQFPIQDIGVLFPVTGAAGASLQGAGSRLYGAFYDSSGRLGIAQGEVYGWSLGTDTLFEPPLQNVPVASETGAGVVTAGVHRIGYLYTTRNGYTGPLCPVNPQTVFTPISFTSTGSHNLQVQIPGPYPAYMTAGSSEIQIVMTTVANPNQYFAVPGAIRSPASAPSIITFSIDDADLAATGLDVTSYINLLSQTVGGTGPFFPSALFTYSSRMGYVTIDSFGDPVVYFSDQNNFQHITADQHGIYLDGQAQPVQCISLRGVCYILTLYATYSVEDSGDVPVKWTPPQLVDGSIGILAPTCVTVNPSLGYAGVASDRGFYIFQGGIYPALPLSYYQQPDWNRINWNVPTTVQVADDQLNKRFIVTAPLKTTIAAVTGGGPYTITTSVPNGINAQSSSSPHLYQVGLKVSITGVTGIVSITSIVSPNMFTINGGAGAPTVGGIIAPQQANAQMTWDYTEGDTPETVKYSLNAFGAYNVGAMATIENYATAVQEVWYTPSVQGVAIRQNAGSDNLAYEDVDSTGNPTSYAWLYETSLFPGPEEATSSVPDSTLHQYCGAHLRIGGTGSISLIAYGIDHIISKVPAASPLALTQFPGKEYLVRWALMSEQQSIQFGMTVFNTSAFLNLIRAYYTEYCPQR